MCPKAPDLIGLLLDPAPPSRGKRIRINAFLFACGDFYLFASLKEFVRGDEFEFNWQFSLRHMSLPSEVLQILYSGWFLKLVKR